MFFTILVVTFIVNGSLTPNIHHIAIAQQQQQLNVLENNQTLPHTKQQPPPFVEDLSFDIDNMTFSHHMASVNGIQLHYVIGGQGDPIVLLHGWPQTWYEWRHIMPALAKNYTVIAPDLRGLGDSLKSLTGYDGKTTAEDIYQLVSQLGFNQPILLVAHDIGSQTAYSYAAAHPNNVSKLVIMDFIFPVYNKLLFLHRYRFTPDVVYWDLYQTLDLNVCISNIRNKVFIHINEIQKCSKWFNIRYFTLSS